MKFHQLDNEERERLAYLSGNPVLMAAVTELLDLEEDVAGLEQEAESATDQHTTDLSNAFEDGKKEGHEEGLAEALGHDAAEVVTALQLESEQHRVRGREAIRLLKGVVQWLRGDVCDTSDGRAKAASQIARHASRMEEAEALELGIREATKAAAKDIIEATQPTQESP